MYTQKPPVEIIIFRFKTEIKKSLDPLPYEIWEELRVVCIWMSLHPPDTWQRSLLDFLLLGYYRYIKLEGVPRVDPEDAAGLFITRLVFESLRSLASGAREKPRDVWTAQLHPLLLHLWAGSEFEREGERQSGLTYRSVSAKTKPVVQRYELSAHNAAGVHEKRLFLQPLQKGFCIQQGKGTGVTLFFQVCLLQGIHFDVIVGLEHFFPFLWRLSGHK